MPSPRSIARLRRALLVVLVLLVAAVVGLYLFGRAGLDGARPAPSATPAEVPGEDVTLAGEGFAYSFEEGGRKVFSIEGRSYRVDRAGKVYIDGMALTAFAADGEPYRLASNSAVYDPKTEATELAGDVTVVGQGGVELSTARLELTERGRTILSREPVSFRYGERAQGSAERMRVDLEERLFVLAGEVRLGSLPGAEETFSLSADRMFFHRQRHHARADGHVAVAYGPHWLKARRLNLWLADDEQGLQFARALWEVRGRLGRVAEAASAPAGTVRFASQNATAVFDPASRELRRVELEGRLRRPATLVSIEEGESPRVLEAGYLTGDLAGGALTRASALGGVRLAEVDAVPPEESWEGGLGATAEEAGAADEGGEPGLGGAAGDAEEGAEEAEEETAGGPGEEARVPTEIPAELPAGTLRLATGGRGEAHFGPEGQLAEVTLHESFALRDPDLAGRGDRARFDLVNGVGEFLGAPVEVTTRDGDLAAPRLLHTQRSGLLYAEGGCRTRLAEATSGGALSGSPLSQGEGPVWVESREAFLRQGPRSFLFRGQVRAWRGENLLLADELQGNADEGRLAASGHVRTLWHPAPAPGEPAAPVEITAGAMAYSRSEGRLVYRREVRAVQAGRALASEALTVELGADGRAEVLRAEGQVRIEDPATGRTIAGDRARYGLAGRVVEVDGERVVMKDRAGAEVTGRRVVYEFETGVVEVQGSAEPAAAR